MYKYYTYIKIYLFELGKFDLVLSPCLLYMFMGNVHGLKNFFRNYFQNF